MSSQATEQVATVQHPQTYFEYMARSSSVKFVLWGVPALLIFSAFAYALTEGWALWLTATLGAATGIAGMPLYFVIKNDKQAAEVGARLYANFLEWQRIEREGIVKTAPPPLVRDSHIVVFHGSEQAEKVLMEYPPVWDAHDSGKPLCEFIEGVDIRDLDFLCEQFVREGHSRSKWLVKGSHKRVLPSGFVINEPKDYQKVVRPFVLAGLIIKRRERVSGTLVSNDPEVLKKHLRIRLSSYRALSTGM
jgi:hypothetical protein